jgi:hypothetical protein
VSDRLDETLNHPPVRPIVEIIGVAVLLFPLTILAWYPIAVLDSRMWRYEGRDFTTGPRGDIEIWSSLRGFGKSQRLDGIEIVMFARLGQRTFAVDPNNMTFRPLSSRSYVPAAPLTHEELVGAIGLGGNPRYDRTVHDAASDILCVVKSLRAGGSPKILTRVALRGGYLLPHQLLWLPTYALACVPVWAFLTILISLRLLRPYRQAKARYRQSRQRLAIEFAAARGVLARE